jgi:hypothetical protein
MHIANKKIRVDVGLSWNAPYTKRWLDEPNPPFVFCFEPNITNVKMLLGQHPRPGRAQYQLELNGSNIHVHANDMAVNYPNLILFPFALGDVNLDNVSFACTAGDPGCSSLYAPNSGLPFVVDHEIKTNIRTLGSILNKYTFESDVVFEALKIDTQGNDFKVLLGAGNFLDNFAFVQFELPSTHCYDGTINFMPYADALLRSKGFNLIAKTLQKDGDAIYQNHRFANLKPDSVFTLHWW